MLRRTVTKGCIMMSNLWVAACNQIFKMANSVENIRAFFLLRLRNEKYLRENDCVNLEW